MKKIPEIAVPCILDHARIESTQEAEKLQPSPVEPPTVNAEVVLDEVKEIVDAASEQNPLTMWIELIVPVLKQGGPVALILALGATSVPLMLLGGGSWVAPILAIGASIVAILASLYK